MTTIMFYLLVGSLSFDPIGFKPHSLPSFLRTQSATAQSITMEASTWNILYSPSMPAHPNAMQGGWYFDFPSCGSDACSIHYITAPAHLSAFVSVRAAFQIETAGTPVFHYKLQPDNTCDYPAHVRYILQRRGDDLSAKSEFYRWFSFTGVELKASSAELTVPLRPEQWISVFGKRGDYNDSTRKQFYHALQELGNVGFVFGGGCFYGHGVNVIGGGSARFLATDYVVE